ncbi:MAG: restriction endonuclease [Candidatus Paceibacteria bacterium]
MARRQYRKRNDSEDDLFSRALASFTGLGLLYFFFTYITDRERFMYEATYYVLPAVAVMVIIFVSYLYYRRKKRRESKEEGQERIEYIITSGFEPKMHFFIERFGKEGKGKGWQYRNYSFDWARIKDFRDELIKAGVHISAEGLKDISGLLKFFIDKKEKEYLAAGTGLVSSDAQFRLFSELNKSGSDLELLVVRLYNAMGYFSKRVGGAGDQGADVIANKNGENVLIQVKSYTNSVNNVAVQQAEAAIKFYGCKRAVVVTNATFTTGARELARANNVELIDGELLKRLLQEHLGELWN